MSSQIARLWALPVASDAAPTGSCIVPRGNFAFRSGLPGVGHGDATSGTVNTNAENSSSILTANIRAEISAEFAADRAALASLIAAMAALQPEPPGQLALLIAEAVFAMVRDVCGATEIDRAVLLSRARDAAALVEDAARPAALHLHPDDAALLADADLPLPVESDAALARGSLSVRTRYGSIEDGIGHRLALLRHELDQRAASL
jgi:hypothetical protein